jgi:hypothetical protein
MAETVLNRKVLRRAVATEMSMPFFRRTSAQEGVMDASSTTTKVLDAALQQPLGYWNGHWFYGLVGGDVSLIRSFTPADHSFQLETPMAATPTTGDKYEIHSLWNAIDIHAAINRAIGMSARSFPRTITDTTQVFCEDKMEYDVSSLALRPFVISRVYGEKPSILIRGAVASATTSSIVISEAATSLSDVTGDFMVSIYAGTGQNQVRNILSVVGTTVNIHTTWAITPDSTSKYAIWNPNKQRYDWERIDIYYTDSPEYPDALKLRTRLPYYYGMRMMIEYQHVDTDLLTDLDDTMIPLEYILPKTCAILHGQKLKDTKVDRDLHYAEYQRQNGLADDYMARNAPRMPSQTLLSSESSTFMDMEDPLGWRD